MEQQLRAGVDAGNAQHALPRPRRAQHRELPAIGSGAFHARKDGPWPEIDVAVATVRIVLVHWPSEPQPDRRSVDGTGERHAGQVGHGAPSSPYSCSRSEEHTSELQSLMRSSYAVFCLKKKQTKIHKNT